MIPKNVVSYIRRIKPEVFYVRIENVIFDTVLAVNNLGFEQALRDDSLLNYISLSKNDIIQIQRKQLEYPKHLSVELLKKYENVPIVFYSSAFIIQETKDYFEKEFSVQDYIVNVLNPKAIPRSIVIDVLRFPEYHNILVTTPYNSKEHDWSIRI